MSSCSSKAPRHSIATSSSIGNPALPTCKPTLPVEAPGRRLPGATSLRRKPGRDVRLACPAAPDSIVECASGRANKRRRRSRLRRPRGNRQHRPLEDGQARERPSTSLAALAPLRMTPSGSAQGDTGASFDSAQDDTWARGRFAARSRMARFGALQGWGGCVSIDFRTDRRSVFLMLW